MEQIGKVKKVFIPEQDIMNSKKIGFVIEVNGEELTFIQEQDEYNARIHRESIVTITKQNINGIDMIDIELYEGDQYE